MKMQKKILLIFLFLMIALTVNCFALSEGDTITFELSDGTVIETTMPEVYEMNEENMKEDPLYEEYMMNTPSVLSSDSSESKSVSISDIIDEYETSNSVVGIDVSSYQTVTDWNKVADSGVKFVIIRCGYRGYAPEGNIVIDDKFKSHIEGAIAAGLEVGVYFYSTAITEDEAIQEAAWVVELIKNYDITYPVAYDFEYFGERSYYSESKQQEIDYRTNVLFTSNDYTQLNNNAKAFLEYIESAGYTAVLYGSKSHLNTYWDEEVRSNYDVWLAHYNVDENKNVANTDYTGDYTMWQCTSSGSVPGISGNVDIDIDYKYYTPFSDVKKSSYYYDAVKYCYTNKIILGFEDSTFKPGNKITRGQLVTILWRMEGEPEPTSSKSPYSDLSSSSYYYKAVLWASENGVVNGYDNGTFKAETNISRQQLAVMLRNYAKYKGIDTSTTTSLVNFPDYSKVSPYALTAMQWAVANGVINGSTSKSDGKTYLKPLDSANRAEAACMIYNYCTEMLE